MKSSRIDKSTYYIASEIVRDFIDRKEPIRGLGPEPYDTERAIKKIEERSKAPIDRDLLSEVLRDQYEKSGINVNDHKILSDQLNVLTQDNSYTITTGHQLCIFTGPLFFPIKVLQVIQMANELNASAKGSKIVPIFWMASEDHDFEEANHIHLFGRRIEWNDEQGGMIGDYTCSSMSETLNEVQNILGDSEKSLELMTIFRKAYTIDNNLAGASRILVHELFGEMGLVIIDGNDKRLKSLFKPYLKREIEEQLSYNCVNQTNNALSDYKIQVNPRPINLFYSGINSRRRIDLDGDVFRENGTDLTWTKNEILNLIDDNPESFSPNVILRPLYQEVILPNIAYVGGPGEIAYWLQLKSMFVDFDVSYPLLSLRNSFVWLDKSKVKKLDKLNLNFLDLFLGENEVVEKLVNFNEDADEITSDIDLVQQAFDRMAEKLAQIDPSMKAYTLAEGRKTEKQLETLKKKLIKAKKDKNREAVDSYWNMHEKVFPKGKLHERYDNFVPYYLKHGRVFFETLLNEINASDHRLNLISE